AGRRGIRLEQVGDERHRILGVGANAAQRLYLRLHYPLHLFAPRVDARLERTDAGQRHADDVGRVHQQLVAVALREQREGERNDDRVDLTLPQQLVLDRRVSDREELHVALRFEPVVLEDQAGGLLVAAAEV